jgi:hypothetical protein
MLKELKGRRKYKKENKAREKKKLHSRLPVKFVNYGQIYLTVPWTRYLIANALTVMIRISYLQDAPHTTAISLGIRRKDTLFQLRCKKTEPVLQLHIIE